MTNNIIRPFEAADAIQLIRHEGFYGNQSAAITSFIALNEVTPGRDFVHSFSWVKDSRVKDFPANAQLGLLLLSPLAYEQLKHENCNFLVVKEPRISFFELLNHQLIESSGHDRIESTALVDPSAVIGKHTYIGHHVVIEAGVVIGDNCIIQHHTVILRNTQIGSHVSIGCHNTLGNAGFGYEKDSNGHYFRLPHLGNVVIGNHVTLHNNICIDRGVLGSTIIEDNANIDNLVHIAHNVRIGANSMVIANSMIGGSTKIGANTWIAPSTSTMNGLTIGDSVTVGLGAVVVKDIQEHTTVAGNPATTMEEIKRWNAIRKRLLQEDTQRAQNND
jgi:UDP-3-O-[3-hydroxymyristoyl] glucosamine N-acyltransferase